MNVLHLSRVHCVYLPIFSPSLRFSSSSIHLSLFILLSFHPFFCCSFCWFFLYSCPSSCSSSCSHSVHSSLFACLSDEPRNLFFSSLFNPSVSSALFYLSPLSSHPVSLSFLSSFSICLCLCVDVLIKMLYLSISLCSLLFDQFVVKMCGLNIDGEMIESDREKREIEIKRDKEMMYVEWVWWVCVCARWASVCHLYLRIDAIDEADIWSCI